MGGWISLHRKIKDNWIWKEKPFSKGQAWIDLILMASHKNTKFVLGNELVEIKRGSLITSEVNLSKRWGWSRTKVRNFLKLLEKDNMISKKADNRKTALSITNYNDYQVQETAEKHQENSKRTAEEQQKNTINNVNNVNNVNKKEYSAFFEEVWSLYPNKKGKGKISDSKRKEVYKLGEEFKRCINRYIDYVEQKKRTDFPELKYQNGSTFFNSGYVDYLDRNYVEEKEISKPISKNKSSGRLDTDHDYDIDEIEKMLLQKSRGG